MYSSFLKSPDSSSGPPVLLGYSEIGRPIQHFVFLVDVLFEKHGFAEEDSTELIVHLAVCFSSAIFASKGQRRHVIISIYGLNFLIATTTAMNSLCN